MHDNWPRSVNIVMRPEDYLSNAHAELADYPNVQKWADVVLGNFFRRGGKQIREYANVLDNWDAFIRFLIRWDRLSYNRLVRASAPQMFQAFINTSQPSNRSLKNTRSKLANERPTIEWIGKRTAEIHIGEFTAEVRFSGDRDRSERHWMTRKWPNNQSRRLGTGLFPRINACLQIITEKFLRDVHPNTLEIHGADAKRNEWNRRVYRNYDAPGYQFYLIKKQGYERAASDGTVAVGWAKPGVRVPSGWHKPTD